MNEENNQELDLGINDEMAQQGPDLDADDTAATLGFITTISEDLMRGDIEQKGDMDGSVSEEEITEETPGSEEDEIKLEIAQMGETLRAEIQALRQDIQGAGQTGEIEAMKKQLESIINSEDDQA